MKKIIAVSILISSFSLNSALAFDMGILKPVNPLDNNPATYQEVVNQPSYELKRGTLTRNAIKNQYTIAMDKFMQSNVRSSYQDFKVLIDNVVPNDYIYMRLTKEMAAIGFFSLAELSMSKIQDNKISALFEEDVKNLLLSMVYKVETSYKDYSKIKRNNLSKNDFIDNIIIKTIKEYCGDIYLIDPKNEEKDILEKQNVIAFSLAFGILTRILIMQIAMESLSLLITIRE